MKRFAWILPIVCLIVASGCASRRAAVATSQPVFVRPPEPVPVPSAPPGNAAYSGYFGPGSGCNSCQQQPRAAAGQPFAAAPGQAFPTQPAPQPVQPSANFAPMPPQGFAPAAPPQPTPAQPAPAQQPAPSQARSGPPQVQLSAPEAVTPSQSASPPNNKTPEPPRASNLPAGIPQFGMVREGVSAGLRPFDEGFDWLKSNGVKTVLHVHLPGEDDQSDRQQIEKRGMKYVALEVSPQTLERKTLEEFVAIVNNSSLHPLFAYDRDSSLAGGLWYGYFRLADMQPDDAARVRAGALGLRETRTGQHLEMWLALQKIFSDR